jgi:hypothetical protein
MNILSHLLCSILLIVSTVSAAPAALPKMRPYTGIGVLLLPTTAMSSSEPLPLYEAPALSRLGELQGSKAPAFEWIFGASPAVRPVIVMARKGTWLRVAYDDAGREGWLNPTRQMNFQAWDLFFKGNVSRMLPGLQKKYYQLYQQPDYQPLLSVTAQQQFKVLQLENDWAMVLLDQSTLGWLRWRDEDGRLVIGVVTEPKVKNL